MTLPKDLRSLAFRKSYFFDNLVTCSDDKIYHKIHTSLRTILSSFRMPFWIHFVSIFDIAFCMRFGKHFDRIPDRNWIQKGSQSGSRIHKKIDFSARAPFQAFMDHFGIILVTCLVPFGRFWGPIVPFWQPFWIVLVPFWSYLLLLQFRIYIFCLL